VTELSRSTHQQFVLTQLERPAGSSADVDRVIHTVRMTGLPQTDTYRKIMGALHHAQVATRGR
jgi:hypothetical protein